MNETTTPTARRSPRRRRPQLFQHLALHPQRLVLAAQPPQLLALIGFRATGTPAVVGIGPLDPVAQRHLGDPKSFAAWRIDLPVGRTSSIASRLNSQEGLRRSSGNSPPPVESPLA
jgi:hypothetical protein